MKDLKLTEEEVKHIAKLANLTLTQTEVKKFQVQLSEVLDYVDVLNELDTDKLEPTSQVTGLENVVRDDLIKESFSQEDALSGITSKNKGMFKTKAIF